MTFKDELGNNYALIIKDRYGNVCPIISINPAEKSATFLGKDRTGNPRKTWELLDLNVRETSVYGSSFYLHWFRI